MKNSHTELSYTLSMRSIKIKSYNDINFVRSGHLFDGSLEKARS